MPALSPLRGNSTYVGVQWILHRIYDEGASTIHRRLCMCSTTESVIKNVRVFPYIGPPFYFLGLLLRYVQSNGYQHAEQRLPTCKATVNNMQSNGYQHVKQRLTTCKATVTNMQSFGYQHAEQRLPTCRATVTNMQSYGYQHAELRLPTCRATVTNMQSYSQQMLHLFYIFSLYKINYHTVHNSFIIIVN